MTTPDQTTDELVATITALRELEEGATYRDTAKGWVGALRKPKDPTKCVRGVHPPHKPMIGLVGPSSKEDRENELRFAFIDELEAVDGPPTGFATRSATDGE